jgi:hypothetical protein
MRFVIYINPKTGEQNFGICLKQSQWEVPFNRTTHYEIWNVKTCKVDCFSENNGESKIKRADGSCYQGPTVFGGEFNDEIAKMQRIAENLARNMKMPENEFAPLLLDAPRFIIGRCLED